MRSSLRPSLLALLALLATLGFACSSPDPAALLGERFPGQAFKVLDGDGFQRRAGGFVPRQAGVGDPVRAAEAALAARGGLRLELPASGDGPVTFSAPGLTFQVREEGLTGPGEPAKDAIAYAHRRGTSYWSAGANGFEEWLQVDDAGPGPVARWEVSGARLRAAAGTVEVLDAHGVARVRVSAPQAFGADGTAARAWLAVQGQRIALHTDARGRALVDPLWTVTGTLGVARSRHVAVLLTTGKVLVAGGRGDAGVTGAAELFDPATGTFAYTGSLNEPREDASATLIADGRVLVAGGLDAGGAPLASAELFDPVTGLFTRTAQDLADARASHTATRLASGQVLVAGGAGAGGALASVEVFDPAMGTWSAAANPLLTARAHHTAALLPSGALFLAGGDGGALDAAEVYDPSSGATDVGPMNGPRTRHTATLLADGTVLLAGGQDGASELSSAEIFDPAEETFTDVGDLGAARADHSATLLVDGRVLVAGGQSGGVAAYECEVYDPGAGLFASAGALGEARALHAAVMLTSGRVLLVGGAGATALASAEVIDQTSGGWAAAGVVLGGRYAHTATLLPNGKVLVAGGIDPWGGYLANTQLYDPETQDWNDAGELLAARAYHTATLLPSGAVLVAGGSAGPSSLLASAELYDPASDQWIPTSVMMFPRASHAATLLANGRVLVTGGETVGGGENPSAEIYDPPAGGIFYSTAGWMSEPRSHHTATLLATGEVLVVGGGNGSHPALATAERYDPASAAFTWVGGPSAGRAGHTATLLPSGRVLVAGGTDPLSGPTAAAELYDPATGWSSTGSMAADRFEHTATLLPSGDVLVAGGRGAGGGLQGVERYEPSDGKFHGASPLGSARRQHSATVLPSGHVLAVGGDLGLSNGAEEYDPFRSTPPSFAPALSGPLPIRVPDAPLSLAGTLLTGTSEASSGDVRSSAANHPVIVLERQGGEGLAYAPVTGFDGTSATARLPASLLPGWWWVRAVVAGAPSAALPLLVLDPFRIDPSGPTVPPRGSLTFTASGASGWGYAWALLVNGSAPGASLDAATGVYVAGETGDTVDLVQVTDSSGNTATTPVTVGPGVSIDPPAPLVPPRGAIPFAAQGGCGYGFTWSFLANLSGGTLDPATGAYQAGPAGGVVDEVQVVDALGNVATAPISVTTPLAIDPAPTATTPLGIVAFTASGGSGAGLVWSFIQNLSGATLDPATGIYQAGRTGLVTDVIQAVDSLGNSANAAVDLGPAITVQPGSVTVPPRGSASFAASGGTDAGFTWSLATNASGGSIDPSTGAYVAGRNGLVTDVVKVVDSIGNEATVAVSVTAGITITPREPGAKPGETILLTAQGGSGTGYVWSMVESTSGGSSIDPATGAYHGGTIRSAVDLVKVVDSLGNEATTDVVIWPDWDAKGSGCGSAGGTGGLGLILLVAALALRARRRAPRLLPRAAAGLALLVAGGVARGQAATTRFVAERFQPSGGAYDVLVVESAQVPGHLAKSARVFVHYADRPLILAAPTNDDVALLRSQTGVDAALSLGLLDWAEVSAVLSGAVSQSRQTDRFVPPALEPDIASAGISDVRVVAKARLVDWRGLRLGLAAPVSFPTGRDDSYLGHGGVTFAPRALVELDSLRVVRILVNGGVVLRQDRQLIDLTIGNAYTYGVAAEVPFRLGVQRLAALATFAGEAGMDDSSAAARPMELLGGLRWSGPRGLALTVGGGPGIGDGYGTPRYRAFAELGFSTGGQDRLWKRQEPAAEPPIAVAEANPEEEKPAEPEPAELKPEVKPTVAEAPPEEAPAADDTLRIDTRIYFAFNRKEIRPRHREALRQLAQRIVSEPRILKVRIEGHADDLGPPEYNQWLSEERSRSVRKLLVKYGVPRSRITIVGFGKTKPVVPGRTRASRAQNRRVEFNVE